MHDATPDSDQPSARACESGGTARADSRRARRFGRAHWTILAVVALFFTTWAGLIAHAGLDRASDGSVRVDRVAKAITAAAIAPPFAGPACRGWQSCCHDVAWQLTAWVGPPLAIAIGVQFIPTRRGGVAWVGRLALWSVALVGWYGSALFSMLHAIS